MPDKAKILQLSVLEDWSNKTFKNEWNSVSDSWDVRRDKGGLEKK